MLPFPTCFWQATTTITVVTKSWSEGVTFAEGISHLKALIKTWGDSFTYTESTSVTKISVKSVTVNEVMSVAEAWVKTTTSLTPAAPSSFSATRQSNQGGVNMSWTDNSTNETSFVVEYSINGGSSWSELKTVSANSTSATDWASFPINKPTISAIDSEDDDKINVSWGSTTYANNYKVYRSTVTPFVPGDSNSVYVGATATTSLQITGLSQDTPYYVIIRGSNDYGDGAFSDISSQSTGPTVPKSFSYVYNSTKYDLTWSNGTRDDTLIRIERSLNSGGSWSEIDTVTAGSTTYSDIRSHTASTQYRIRYNGEASYAT